MFNTGKMPPGLSGSVIPAAEADPFCSVRPFESAIGVALVVSVGVAVGVYVGEGLPHQTSWRGRPCHKYHHHW
jgi:hypothetical protein